MKAPNERQVTIERVARRGIHLFALTLVFALVLASSPVFFPASAQEPSTPESLVQEPPAAPTVPPAPEPTAVPTLAPTPQPTVAPTPEPTIAPTIAPTVAPTPTSAPRSISPMSIDPGTASITRCSASGSDQLQPGGTYSATCSFSRFGSHPADFTFGALTSPVTGATSGWQLQLAFGTTSTNWVSTQTTFRAPANSTSFTVSLRAPSTGGISGAAVSSLVSLQMCNPGSSCEYGSTTIEARLVGADLSRVTMTCSPASPTTIVRLQTRLVTCTISVPSDFGTTSVALRSVTIPAPASGWGMTTSPAGTTAPGGAVTIAPARTLAAGQTWSFSYSPSPSCSATTSANWNITSRIAPVTGGVTGQEVNGPNLTYTANATLPTQTASASIVNSSLTWAFAASFDDQTAAGSLTYRVTGAGCSGWNVSMAASPFTYFGSTPGSSIPANSLTLTNAGPASVISGDGTGVAPTGVTGGLGTTRKVISAQPGAGNGTYEHSLGVSVTVPGGTTVGSYRSTITVTAAAAP